MPTYRYLHIQEAPQTDNITADGHVGARMPWPVTADEDGKITTPSSLLGMVRVVGFQRDLAVMQVDVWWKEVLTDPQKAVGMYLVHTKTDGGMAVSLSAVDTVEVWETEHEIPVER
jgi:hypothetical protein